MKDKELLASLKDQGFTVTLLTDLYTVRNTAESDPIMWIGKTEPYSLDTRHIELEKLDADAIDELLDVVMEYIATPITERQEEPRFRVRLAPVNNTAEYPYCTIDNDGVVNRYVGSHRGKVFTPTSYAKFWRDHPEWQPFLREYDLSNMDVFVPVEDGESDD